MAFGSTTSFDAPRPFPSFLLPSLPSFFRGRRSASSPSASSRHSIAASENGHGSLGPRESYRSSVASASSTLSSFSGHALPPLCTSPSSYASSPSSFSGSPIAGSGSGSSSSAWCPPSFATALTAEPEYYSYSTGTPARPTRTLRRVRPNTLRCVKCSADIAFVAQIVSKGFTGRHGRAYLVSAPATNESHLFAPEVPATKPVDRDPRDNNLMNIRVGRNENRQLVTGAHVVADITCAVCHTKLGWKYVDARDAAQRYKVGKFILEIARVSSFRSWEDVGDEDGFDEFDEREEHEAHEAHGRSDDDDPDVLFPLDAVVHPIGRVRRLMTRHDIINDRKPSTAKTPIEFDSDDEDECEEIFAGTWDAETVAKRRGQKAVAAMRA